MQLAAMANFPAERAAIEALAKALERSAMDTGIMMQAILDNCLSGGSWCPTPFDIRGVAVNMKQQARDRKEGRKAEKWQRIYGEANPQWSKDLLDQLVGRNHADSRQRLHERALRDMLYYTEGDGMEMGDRAYWQAAKERDERDHGPLIAEIRERGGWQTERELWEA